MSAPESLAHPRDVVRLLIRYPLRWLVPTLLVSLAAFSYAAMRRDTWEAAQTLLIRNDAAGNPDAPGRFRHSDELKTLLETVLELARSRIVLHDALAAVDGRAPSPEVITDTADCVKLSPPKGAEFGKTEVFYLKVKDHDPRRAVALAEAICQQLESRFQNLRNTKARSMVDELRATLATAADELQQATERLAELERGVGIDLGELRTLHQASSTLDSDLRKKALEMNAELRQAVDQERRLEACHLTLRAAQSDPTRLVNLPAGLTESQPMLRRLKDHWIDAQQRTAQLLGTMTETHPQVQAARFAERQILEQFKLELELATRAAATDLALAQEKVARLTEELPRLQSRMEKLATLRAEYSRRVAEVDHRTQLWKDAQRALVAAQAAQTSAASTSLVTRVERPEVGSQPLGPGRSVIAAAGVAGGLVLGVGVLLLSLPVNVAPDPLVQPLPSQPDWQRWSGQPAACPPNVEPVAVVEQPVVGG